MNLKFILIFNFYSKYFFISTCLIIIQFLINKVNKTLNERPRQSSITNLIDLNGSINFHFSNYLYTSSKNPIKKQKNSQLSHLL